MSEYITIKEAIETTGKSRSTIKNYMREVYENEPINRQKNIIQEKGGKKYILRTYIEERAKRPRAKSKISGQNEGGQNKPTFIESLLKDAISSKDQQLTEKNQQLKEKDVQIAKLQESEKELRELLKREQELHGMEKQAHALTQKRLHLVEAPTAEDTTGEKPEVINAEFTDHPKSSPKEEAPTPQKGRISRFFKSLFPD